MATSVKRPAGKSTVTGKIAATVSGFVLMDVGGKNGSAMTPPGSTAAALLPKLARALSEPGISRDAVFKGRTKNAYSYSVDATNTANIVRVDAAGKREVGRLVGERFVPV